jgi:riboflavin synthase
MFTGIVEQIGIIEKSGPSDQNRRVTISARQILSGLQIGESVAVDGVCLTVVSIFPSGFCADISQETERITTLGDIPVGRAVNLERSMRLSDRLGGHLVLGHVDGIGKIRAWTEEIGGARFVVDAPPQVLKYCVRKGSIAVDGVSLTLNEVTDRSILFCIIPHTAHMTTLGAKRAGSAVNLECDPIAKYVELFCKRYDASTGQKRAAAGATDEGLSDMNTPPTAR